VPLLSEARQTDSWQKNPTSLLRRAGLFHRPARNAMVENYRIRRIDILFTNFV
jgi:hypothetical protein